MILKYSHCLKRITFSDLIVVSFIIFHATPVLGDVLVKLNCRLDITYRQSDGIREKKITTYHYCSTARDFEHLCGEEGKKFEAK